MKRGRKYLGRGEEYNVEKSERGSNIIFPVTLRLLGRILNRKEDGTFKEENKDFKKMRVGKNIKLQGTLYTPA